MGLRALAAILLTTLLVATIIPVGVSANPAGEPLRFGWALGSVDELQRADVPITYGSFWVGAWTDKQGWGYAEGELRRAKALNVTPVIHWWYWGDDISPTCIEKGCWSSLHNVWKDRATWDRMSVELADLVKREMGGGEAIVVLENEFNKAGTERYEPFDGALAEKAEMFRTRDVKTVVGFGFWGASHWPNFDRAVAAADYAGTMMLRSSVRHASSYDGSAADLLKAAQDLQTLFGKKVLLYDFALSSYPEPDYATKQETQFRELFRLMPDFRAAGVEGILFRHLYDNPRFNTANYNGEAERHWGLKRADASAKPAYDDAVLGIHREADHPVEAEGFRVPGAGGLVGDGGASKGTAWSLHEGAMETRILAWESGHYALTVTARGFTDDDAKPRLSIYVDDVRVRSVNVGTAWAEERVVVALGKGDHVVRLSFDNPSEAHVLRIDRLVYRGTTDAPSAPPLPLLGGRVEAEDFAAKTTGGRYDSTGASGGAGWNVWSNGAIEHALDVADPGRYRFEVRAAGDLAGSEPPRMVLRANGGVVAAWDVTSSEHRTYRADVDLAQGPVVLRVEFTNDWYQKPYDRNLRVDAVTAGPAPSPQSVWAREAEAFAAKSTGGRYGDSAASAAAGWNVWSNGAVSDAFETTASGPHELRIRAKGDYASGEWPLMRAYVDGRLAGEWRVSSTSYDTYTAKVDLAGGVHAVDVWFVNDYYSRTAGDRNLRVDHVDVRA